jgi:hypothetical protein
LSENTIPPGQTIVAWTMRASNKNKRNSSRSSIDADLNRWSRKSLSLWFTTSSPARNYVPIASTFANCLICKSRPCNGSRKQACLGSRNRGEGAGNIQASSWWRGGCLSGRNPHCTGLKSQINTIIAQSNQHGSHRTMHLRLPIWSFAPPLLLRSRCEAGSWESDGFVG